MSHQISHVFRLTLIASAIAAIPSLHAQTPDATNATRTVERVEVIGSADNDAGATTSAARSQTPIAKTPQSVVVLTRRLLDEQGVTTLPDALRNVGAVRAMDARDVLNGGLRIRGFDAGVIVDGVTLPGSFSTPESLAGVARVEVVKGPTGTLYGGSQAAGNNGFMGGAVAVVTAAPDARASREVGARFGTRGDQGVSLDFNQPLSGTVAARVSADWSQVDSETDFVTHKRLAFQPSLAWRPDADRELVLRYRHQESAGRDFSGLPRKGTVEAALWAVPRSRNLTADGLPDSEAVTDIINAQWSQRINSTWSWNLQLAQVRASVDQRGVFPLDSTTFGWPATSALDGPYYGLFGARLWNQMESTVVAPSLTGKFVAAGAKHTVTAGLDFDRTKDDAFLRFSPNFGFLGIVDIANPLNPAWAEADTTGAPDQINRYQSTSLWVQDHADFGALNVMASVRQTRISVDDVNPAYGYDTHSKHNKLLGRFGATYALTPQASVFAGWGQAMRIPTFSIFSAPVKPELADQTEVGVKLNNLNGITATIALFDLKLKNAVVADPVNFGKSIQIGSESSRGLDVDVQWQLSPAWRMLASLNHQTPKNDDTGKQMLNVPKTSARLASHYQFGSSSIVPGLGVGVGLTHHSALPGDAANTFFTPSATVYDVQLSYTVGQARIGLSATNISDKQYYVPTRYFGGGQVLPAPGRAISATLRYTF